MDLGVLFSESPSTAAAVFTTNKVVAPSILVNREYLKDRRAQAVVVNSGIANVAVGEQGLKDSIDMTELAAAKLGLAPQDVLVASTGVIGVELPMARIRSGIQALPLSSDGGHQMARGILTTDSHTKEIAVSVDLGGGRQATIGGIAKGAGMIHPDMATTLCFMATDATVEAEFLQRSLFGAIDVSFNMISIDGDTSTSDTAIILANGMAGNDTLTGNDQASYDFQEALTEVCTYLGKQVARDGEGATKLIEIQVDKAGSKEDARRVARTVSTSILVKTAAYGNDPNWGRIMAALGRSGATITESKVDIFINDMILVNNGTPVPFYPDAVSRSLDQEDVSIRIILNLGEDSATSWTCDLSEEYVTFNSKYTT